MKSQKVVANSVEHCELLTCQHVRLLRERVYAPNFLLPYCLVVFSIPVLFSRFSNDLIVFIILMEDCTSTRYFFLPYKTINVATQAFLIMFSINIINFCYSGIMLKN